MQTRSIHTCGLFGITLAALAAISSMGCGGGSEAAPTASVEGSTSAADQQAPPVLVQLDPPAASAQSPATRPQPPKNLHPLVEIVTSAGTVRVELNAEKAPKTVENFLENYVDTGFYEQTIVHYVEQGFMIAAGGYTSDLKAKETRTEIRHEGSNGLKNLKGTIAMARHPLYIDSATSQFFFNLADNSGLDYQVTEQDDPDETDPSRYGYCVFGKVVQGMDVLDKIALLPVADKPDFPKTPVEPVVIQSVRIVE